MHYDAFYLTEAQRSNKISSRMMKDSPRQRRAWAYKPQRAKRWYESVGSSLGISL